MMIVDLDIEDVKTGLREGSILLVDVREPHEFAAGHIPGAIAMPLSGFDPSRLPEAGDKRIVFSCAAGVRSVQALMLAQQAGLRLDAHYRGGFKDWLHAGEAIEAGA